MRGPANECQSVLKRPPLRFLILGFSCSCYRTYIEDSKAQIQPLVEKVQAEAEKIQEQMRPYLTNIEEQMRPMADNLHAQIKPLADNFQAQIEQIFQQAVDQAKALLPPQ